MNKTMKTTMKGGMCMGSDADRHGRQSVPLGVLGLHADTRQGLDKGLCRKLPV